MSVSLSGSRVLVTGASGGIGLAIARALHGRGATVIATARRQEVLDGLRADLDDGVEVVRADLADRSEVESLPRRAGRVDVLVANAALPGSGAFDDFSAEEVDRVKLRYRSKPLPCRVRSAAGGRLALELGEPVDSAAPGQLACLMRGDAIVGHGVIDSPAR